MYTTLRRFLLLPLSLFYSLLTCIRNFLFDIKILAEKGFEIPVIGIGNLTLGGSGKTVLTEYILDFLISTGIKPAVLSRGYKRKTKGFLRVDLSGTAQLYGDEPLQIACKFPETVVAVSESRSKGIARIIADYPDIQVVILDDSFQHRYVKPSLNILLTEYSRPFFNDCVLPSGRLRELASGKKRADMVLVTKCPPELKETDAEDFQKKLGLNSQIPVFFCSTGYKAMINYFTSEQKDEISLKTLNTVVFSGIADSKHFKDRIKSLTSSQIFYDFSDHHYFNEREIERIIEDYRKMDSENTILVTTEKDISRIRNTAAEKLFHGLPLYYLPVHCQFLFDRKNDFDKKILDICLRK